MSNKLDLLLMSILIAAGLAMLILLVQRIVNEIVIFTNMKKLHKATAELNEELRDLDKRVKAKHE